MKFPPVARELFATMACKSDKSGAEIAVRLAVQGLIIPHTRTLEIGHPYGCRWTGFG